MTKDEAGLWTDGRYFIQAESQLEGSTIKLFKMGQEGCPTTDEYLYKNINITQAENRYHLPQYIITICDRIGPEEGEERVWAIFPPESVHYVRQYTSEIQMPYGREMLVASWEHVEHPIYALMKADIIRIDLLAELADDYKCQYIILNKAKQTEGDPGACGLEKIAEVGGYDVYRNSSVELNASP